MCVKQDNSALVWVYAENYTGDIFMKALLINGSPNEKGCTFTALEEVAGSLNKNGIETEIYQITPDGAECLTVNDNQSLEIV